MKLCCYCKKQKEDGDFSKRNRRGRIELRSRCKPCENLYYENNKEKCLLRSKNSYKKNVKRYEKVHREYRLNNKEKRRENERRKRKTNPQFKMAENLRGRMAHAIKDGQKGGSAVKDLGCSVAELKLHLESKFQPGMTWDNWSRTGWHIDHVKPLASFDLTDREQFLKACHYTNLQPLWAKDNLSKGATVFRG